MPDPEPDVAPSWGGRRLEDLRREWRVPALQALDTTPSTSDVARRLAEAGAPHATTVVANHQTAGRGRHGREWLDRHGESLLLSMVLLSGGRAGRAGDPAVLPLLVGLACARAIRTLGGPTVGIEWPNDLVVDDRKLGGILCESALRAGTLDFVIVGIGINVAGAPDLLEESFTRPVTSLAAVTEVPIDRVALAGEVVRRVGALHTDSILSADDLAELRSLDALAGRRVRLATGREGLSLGILPDGSLAIDDDGERITVNAGSVAPVARRAP